MAQEEKIQHRPYLYKVGDTFNTRNGPMTVIDRFRIQREDKVFRKHYMLQCEKGHRYDVDEGYLKSGRLKTCKKCNHPTIADFDPDFASWFVDPSIPRTRSCGCHDKVDFYCPNCGKIVRGKSINNIYKRKQVPCPYCSNGVSYPERYMIALLEQLKVPFIHQYTVQVFQDGKKSYYRYDFFDPDRQLIIEVHGQQHYEAGTFERLGGYTLEQIQKIDKEKIQYATKTLGLNYVVLDCRKSDSNWIHAQVVRNLKFYALDAVDWDAVRQYANKSVVLQMIDLIKNGYTCRQIGEIVHMSPSTVSQKLQKAQQDGLYDGITPRKITAETRKRLQEERRQIRLEKQRQMEELQQRYEQQHKEKQQQKNLFRREIQDKISSLQASITLLEPFGGKRSRIKFRCNICEKEFRRSPEELLKDDRCPSCKKLEELKQNLFRAYGDEYEILDFYTDHRTPMRIRHKVCGEIYQETSGKITRHGCPVCSNRQRIEKTVATKYIRGEKKFFSVLPAIEKRGYTYIGPFYGWGEKNPFLCSHCGQVWWTTANSILNGRDHICISPCKKKTHEIFVQQVYELVGNEYSVVGEYRNALEPIKMRHNICGLEYLVTPAHFTSTGRRCPFCTKNATQKDIEKRRLRFNRVQLLYKGWEKHSQFEEGTDGFLDYIWNKTYEAAVLFRAQHGHLDIPYNYVTDGICLGSWLGEQRKFYRRGNLSEERIRRLEDLKICWNPLEGHWDERYEKSKQYLCEHGFPRLHENSGEDEKTCYYWLHDQIKLLRKGKLPLERVELLKEIGIKADYYADEHFDSMCKKLETFIQINGHCIVPEDEGQGEEHPLGAWAQRMRMQLSAGTLPEERAMRLKAMGLPENNKEAKFWRQIGSLSVYFHKHGNLLIPQSYEENGEKLGRWINRFRVLYSKGMLSEERIKALESIGMVWGTNQKE